MKLDPLKAYKTPLTGDKKKEYDENWDRIEWKKKKVEENTNIK